MIPYENKLWEVKVMLEENLYKLGKKLRLNKKDINTVLKNRKASDKSISLLLRDDSYEKGSYYGTISVKDF